MSMSQIVVARKLTLDKINQIVDIKERKKALELFIKIETNPSPNPLVKMPSELVSSAQQQLKELKERITQEQAKDYKETIAVATQSFGH